MSCASGAACGHYTQMVWGKTRYLGCGWARCPDWGWDDIYLVCNYAQAGNTGGTPYSKTTPPTTPVCSRCEADLHECTDSLCDGCANPDFYTDACVDEYTNCYSLCA